MANSNISNSSFLSIPTFVPRIVTIATYTQNTQTRNVISTSSSVQTDTQTYNSTATQTETSQITSPLQNSKAVQRDHMLNEISPFDSTESSTSTDILAEVAVSINQPTSNRKGKTQSL